MNTAMYAFSDGPFSLEYPAQIVLDGKAYTSVLDYVVTKQYAFLFGECRVPSHDADRLQALCTPDPNRTAPRARHNLWRLVARDVLMRANLAKFTNDLKLRAQLMLTESSAIVYASRDNRVYGAGLSTLSPSLEKLFNEGNLPGKNWLGESLTQLRDHLTVLTCCTTAELPTGFLHE